MFPDVMPERKRKKKEKEKKRKGDKCALGCDLSLQ